MNLRVFTVADLHQSGSHYRWLLDEVEAKRPDVVAFVGDVVSDSGISQSDRVRTEDAAELLSNLPCPQLVFVRGNHPGMVLILTIEQADEIERIREDRLHGLRCP
jgi:predicted MPP superfamily phosphohydrolase